MKIEISTTKIKEVQDDLHGLTGLLDTSIINNYGSDKQDVLNAIQYNKTLHYLIGVLEIAK